MTEPHWRKEAIASLKIERGPESAAAGSRGWIWLAAALLVAAVVATWFFWPRATPVRTALVEEASGGAGAAAVLNASGYVTARRQATVSSKVTGKVVEVHVEEGMRVEAGQVLARLDDSQARLVLALHEAQATAAERATGETAAQLREARLRETRTRELRREGVASQAEVDAVEAAAAALAARLAVESEQAEVARRQVALSRQDLEDTVIRAPFSGIAISKNAQPGEMISPVSAGGGFTRTGISTLVDMASLEVEVDVNEAYIQRVQAGQKVTATLDAYPQWPIPAHVITTIPAAEREKATVKVRVGFDQLDPRILPDMGVKVAFLAVAGTPGERRSLLLPRAAVRGSPLAELVWVVKEGRLERRAIRLAGGDRDPVEVLAGLAAGERVVVEGPEELAAGQRVSEREE